MMNVTIIVKINIRYPLVLSLNIKIMEKVERAIVVMEYMTISSKTRYPNIIPSPTVNKIISIKIKKPKTMLAAILLIIFFYFIEQSYIVARMDPIK